jgi:hypothetical protein
MKLRILFSAILAISLLPSVAVAEMSLSDKYQNLNVVNPDDWREGDFDMTWSKLVVAEDDFDGQYLAVFDREKKGLFGAEAGIISEWSQKQIKVNFYYSVKQLFGGARVSVGYAKNISLKVGDSVFKLESNNGFYTVTDEMAKAFANAPNEPVKMRISPFENDGNEYMTAFEDTTIELDMETINAWKTVYVNQEVVSKQ